MHSHVSSDEGVGSYYNFSKFSNSNLQNMRNSNISSMAKTTQGSYSKLSGKNSQSSDIDSTGSSQS